MIKINLLKPKCFAHLTDGWLHDVKFLAFAKRIEAHLAEYDRAVTSAIIEALTKTLRKDT